MYIPYLSPRLERQKAVRKFSSSSSSPHISSSSSSRSKTKRSSAKTSFSSFRKRDPDWTESGSPAFIIPAGQPFAGRVAGGAGRDQIFGTRTYGSGYPGVLGRGTAGRGFPFIYWPIVWPVDVDGGAATAAYLDDTFEYGEPTNTSRPGGALAYATFTSLTSPQTIFHVLADNATTLSLIPELSSVCASLLSPSIVERATSTPFPNSALAIPTPPQPESAVQYYRASSIVLTLNGYNNSATYAAQNGTSDSPLPQGGDISLMNCLNTTIGLTAPLVGGSSSWRLSWTGGRMELVGLVWLVWMFLELL